tara:strand:- start:13176 stop:13493 length:318 start_codon:yes stop_codon:yes gene_type:complete
MQTAQTYNNQFEYDNALPPEDHAADSLETECTIFAERFTDNQMDAPTFFELAEAFGSETIGDYLGDDDQHNLLQLVLKHSKDPLAKAVVGRLYTAAYNHREGELK